MPFNFDEVENRRGTDSVKWSEDALEAICSNRNADAFWVADMDFRTEPHIKAKAVEEAERGIFGYPVETPVTDVFAAWTEKRHNWKIDTSRTVFVNGLLHGIGLAIDIFTKPGDKILVPEPTYRPFVEMCEDSGRIRLPLQLRENGDGTFSFDKDDFRKAAKEADMILFCSPHNPTGIVFSHDELCTVLETAKSRGIPVISDEIHADLTHPSYTHIPMGAANEKVNADVITFMAPSKTFNLAGEHAGFAVFSNEEMLREYERKQRALRVTSPGYTIKQLMCTAYSEGYEYNKELCEYLEGNVKAIESYLRENCPEVKVSNSGSSFVAFLDFSEVFDRIREKVLSDPEKYRIAGGILSTFFGVEAAVCMNDGTWFGPYYEKYARINYGTSRKLTLNAVERIVRAIKSL